MSVAKLVTRGFGNGSFAGSIASIVTLGYISGVASDSVATKKNTYNLLLSVRDFKIKLRPRTFRL